MTFHPNRKQPFSRRQFLQNSAAASAGLLLAACAVPLPQTATPPPTVDAPDALPESAAEAPILEPTPQCDDHDETIAQTEGPFYTSNTPERASLLEEGMAGTHLIVTGRVLTTGCTPIAGAILDFWQADDAGRYDNVGYRLRGHQFTGEDGVYRLETILPGLYPGRTRHIHVKVQGPNTSLLTTQIYFPDEPANARDSIFHPALVVDMRDSAAGKEATFDFVLS
ncbi:MAG: twin-arginine translocation signal domain-containing protein [Caldilineaceae bacterium]|nr:twin-arginine translocation signal domain-containing protein [Caldilineaceae bacterium]